MKVILRFRFSAELVQLTQLNSPERAFQLRVSLIGNVVKNSW